MVFFTLKVHLIMFIQGAAGLIGGALLEDAFEDHDEHEREEGFDQG
jgi:hypothetical protein